MQGKTIATWIAIVLGFGVGAYLIWGAGAPKNVSLPLGEGEDQEEGLLTYSSAELGVAFQYPSKYFVEEKTVNSDQRLRKAIVLIEDTPANRQLVSGEVVGEGPTAITLEVFQNNLDKSTAIDFIKGSNFSNYKLGSGETEEGTISGLKAYHYDWDGLYKGESVVTVNENFVYMFSVTSLADTDEIRSDFYKLLGTVEIK